MNIPFISPKGFTLIETVISVALLGFAIVGPMTLSSSSIRASRDSRMHLEAIHLAEEGVEVIRNIRDNNSAPDPTPNGSAWRTSLAACNGGCAVNALSHNGFGVWGSFAISPCTGGTCEVVKYDSNTGTYFQNPSGGASQNSPFRRRVVTTDISPRQTRITSVVSYPSVYGNIIRYATATDDIYNWYPCTLAVGCPP